MQDGLYDLVFPVLITKQFERCCQVEGRLQVQKDAYAEIRRAERRYIREGVVPTEEVADHLDRNVIKFVETVIEYSKEWGTLTRLLETYKEMVPTSNIVKSFDEDPWKREISKGTEYARELEKRIISARASNKSWVLPTRKKKKPHK